MPNRPPKEWWDRMEKEIREGNPDYSEEQTRKTVGDIWYNKMAPSTKREETKKSEGSKHISEKTIALPDYAGESDVFELYKLLSLYYSGQGDPLYALYSRQDPSSALLSELEAVEQLLNEIVLAENLMEIEDFETAKNWLPVITNLVNKNIATASKKQTIKVSQLDTFIEDLSELEEENNIENVDVDKFVEKLDEDNEEETPYKKELDTSTIQLPNWSAPADIDTRYSLDDLQEAITTLWKPVSVKLISEEEVENIIEVFEKAQKFLPLMPAELLENKDEITQIEKLNKVVTSWLPKLKEAIEVKTASKTASVLDGIFSSLKTNMTTWDDNKINEEAKNIYTQIEAANGENLDSIAKRENMDPKYLGELLACEALGQEGTEKHSCIVPSMKHLHGSGQKTAQEAPVALDKVKVSHAFDAGNYASGYVSIDFSTAWRIYQSDEHFAGNEYADAFILGFFSSHELNEIPMSYLDEYTNALHSAVGKLVQDLGYIDPVAEESHKAKTAQEAPKNEEPKPGVPAPEVPKAKAPTSEKEVHVTELFSKKFENWIIMEAELRAQYGEWASLEEAGAKIDSAISEISSFLQGAVQAEVERLVNKKRDELLEQMAAEVPAAQAMQPVQVEQQPGIKVQPVQPQPAQPVSEAPAQPEAANKGAASITKKIRSKRMVRKSDHDEGTIRDSMARTLFVSAWADHEEEEGRTYPGQELMDVAPETPNGARRAADALWAKLQAANPDREITTPAGEDPDLFGHYLAMEALGHGVAWTDDHEPHGYKVPYFEFYWDGEEGIVASTKTVKKASMSKTLRQVFDQSEQN